MKLLSFLAGIFIRTFGITQPKPEQERMIALALGGVILFFFLAVISMTAWLLISSRG